MAAAALHGRRHAVVIGINYLPEHTGIGPYTAGLARHLVRLGDRVTAMTGIPHYPAWRKSPGKDVSWAMHERRGGVQVRRFPHVIPERQSAVQRALYEFSFLGRAWSAHRVDRPDYVIGVVPSLTGGMLARGLGVRSNVPYGVLFQDLMGLAAQQSGISGGGRVARVTTVLERWAVQRAAAVAVVSEAFRPYVESLGVDPGRIVVLRNWSHIAEPKRPREATREALGWLAGDVIVLHAGNMGLKQGLEQVITAARIAATTAPSVRFVLLGDGNQRETLQGLAAGLGNVQFLPPVPEAEFPEVLAAADVLLLAERSSVREMSLPSKLTSYFTAGRPVVAAVTVGGATSREIDRAGGGLAVPAGDPQALVDALAQLRDDAEMSETLGAAGLRYARRALSAEAAFADGRRFLELLRGTPSQESAAPA